MSEQSSSGLGLPLLFEEMRRQRKTEGATEICGHNRGDRGQVHVTKDIASFNGYLNCFFVDVLYFPLAIYYFHLLQIDFEKKIFTALFTLISMFYMSKNYAYNYLTFIVSSFTISFNLHYSYRTY